MGALEQAKTNLGRAAEAGDTSAQTELGLVDAALRSGDPAAARRALEVVKKRELLGNDAIAMLEGDVLVLEGRDAEAVEQYRVALAEGNAPAVLPMAGALQRSEGPVAAIEFLRGAMPEYPNHVAALRRLGELELVTGEYREAIVTFEALSSQQPDNAQVLNNLAWLYLETNNPKALEVGKRAYDLAPKNPDIADTFGWILVKTGGDAREATRLLEQAASGRKANATIRYHLAEAYTAASRLEDGGRAVREALAMGEFPERADAEALLHKIESAPL